MVNSKPILFNAEMVKAILDGKKSQFREVIEKYNNEVNHRVVRRMIETGNIKQKYKVGDILYVKETFLQEMNTTLMPCGTHKEFWGNKIEFVADGAIGRFLNPNSYNSGYMVKRPSVHLKQKDARIFLKVTSVRVERLQDITNKDIINEGMPLKYKGVGNCFKNGGSEWWINLWSSTSEDGYKWEDNPFVFVYEFERVQND